MTMPPRARAEGESYSCAYFSAKPFVITVSGAKTCRLYRLPCGDFAS